MNDSYLLCFKNSLLLKWTLTSELHVTTLGYSLKVGFTTSLLVFQKSRLDTLCCPAKGQKLEEYYMTENKNSKSLKGLLYRASDSLPFC